ncbi:ATPase/GTPase, AAA15 family [Methylobacterium sp. yr596]|nr:AAA family ATPase [Methylobacterium currus]SFF25014.1 ATPase/GTPase, AAA15 family [Methylobacterium sp. yr596]
MIKAVSVENFMRIDQRVDIDLNPVTILVGGNGSGKSSILKAIHWAVRCATLKDWRDNTSLDRMDYTPSRAFQELAHKKRIQSKDHLPKIKVGFIDDSGEETIINISSARNDAGAKAPIIGPLARSLTQETPQTAYIPGLAGLAEVETVLAAPVLHRRAASGEGGSVLRHIILDLAGGSASEETEHRHLSELSSWVSRVLPESQFWVKFDRLRDVSIEALFYTPDMKETGRSVANQRRPLEMAGTGYLQVVQIFAYLLKFKPKLLLIDEPDAHLHPSTQERLIKALEEAAAEFPETKFILSTHSPHLVRAASSLSRVHWMENGHLRADSEDKIRLRMGWGALDKGLILFTEDEDMSYLKSIISQWPDLDRKILLWPTFGHGGIPSGDSLNKLRSSLGIPVFVHRDRDFMSDNDINHWREAKGFARCDIPSWVPSGADIESLFCDPSHIENTMGFDPAEAQVIFQNALASFAEDQVERDFTGALDSAVRSLPIENRSLPGPRWRELGGFGRHTIKGKLLLSAIENEIKIRLRGGPEARRLALLPKLRRPHTGCVIAGDLRSALEVALA